jgi:hypothetical protein
MTQAKIVSSISLMTDFAKENYWVMCECLQ